MKITNRAIGNLNHLTIKDVFTLSISNTDNICKILL